MINRWIVMSGKLFRALIVILLVVASLWCASSSALALGIGASPARMAFSVRPGSSELKALSVVNQDNQESNFEVYIEGQNDKWFTIIPAKFTLKGQERKSVKIVLAPPILAEPQEYDVAICAVSLPSGSELNIGAGVKVSAHVEIAKLPIMAIQWWILSAVILAVMVIGLIIWWRYKKRYA
jgi:P pilus assembly chaperone PapD